MDQVQNKKPRRRAALLTQVVIKEPAVVKSESEDLNLHTQLCAERYKDLERRLEAFDDRLAKVEDQISSIKKEMAAGFNNLQLLIEKQNNSRTVQLIATFGTIAAAIVGVMGYLITH
jgi:hypothetical protein